MKSHKEKRAKERGLGQLLLSQISEGTNSAHTLILDFKFLWLKAPSLWCFVTAALGDESSGYERAVREMQARGLVCFQLPVKSMTKVA